MWIRTPPDPASAVTQNPWLRDPVELKFMLTSGQVWKGDADGLSSWATYNTWSGPDALPSTLAQLADSAQNVPCKQDNCKFAGRARHTAALGQEVLWTARRLWHGGLGFTRISAKHGQGQGHAGSAKCVRRTQMPTHMYTYTFCLQGSASGWGWQGCVSYYPGGH